MIDLTSLQPSQVAQLPYPHALIKQAIAPHQATRLLADFPQVDHPGSIPIHRVHYGDAFAELLTDLHSDQFRDGLQTMFGIDLSGAPILTTVRGVMRNKDGRIHTDSKNKLLTILLYFNQDWNQQQGCLRILNNGTDLEDYVTEIPPTFGTMLIFQVTDNCWHGHYPVTGKRLSLQMNYLASSKAYAHFQAIHTLSEKVKRAFGRRH